MSMTKSDLVAAIADKAGLTKKAAGDALEALLDTVTTALAAGGQVTVTGFGTFKISHRKARVGVNPQNPTQKIQIPASNVPTFKAGKQLKQACK